MARGDERFEKISGDRMPHTTIIRDTETGVNYLYAARASSDGGCAITPLLDERGNVVITHSGADQNV